MTRTSRPPHILVALLGAVLAAGFVAVPAAAAPEQLVLRDLDRGPDPAVPYVLDGTLLDGDLRVDLPPEVRRFLGRLGADYLLQGFDEGNGAEVVVRVTPEGRATTLAQGASLSDATLSPDGTSFVASRAYRTDRTVLKRYDAGTGDVTLKREVDGYATVLDYDGSTAVIGGFGPEGTSLWDLTNNGTTRLSTQPGYVANLAADRLARFSRDPYLGGCTVVSSISRPRQEIWRSCEDAVVEFSTDGSRIATTYILSDGLGPARVRLRKTGGRLLGTYDAPYVFGVIRFENARALLLETFSRRSVAGVRCDGATCERATVTARHGMQFRTGIASGPGG